MACYSVPSDMVPDDGRPYVADWCPNEQAVRPFSIEVDAEGDEYLVCLCGGYVQEYEGTDSPCSWPIEDDEAEAEDEPGDEPEDDWDDAMTVSFTANSTAVNGGPNKWVVGVAPSCTNSLGSLSRRACA